jgi:hypothetical protein
MNQTRAFIDAGFSPHGARQNASRLMKRDDIRARYEHLMGQKAPVLDMKQVATAGLLETVDVSKIRRTPTTMLRALRNLSRLHGFRVWSVCLVDLTAEYGVANSYAGTKA